MPCELVTTTIDKKSKTTKKSKIYGFTALKLQVEEDN